MPEDSAPGRLNTAFGSNWRGGDSDEFNFSRDLKNMGNFEFIPVGDPPKGNNTRKTDASAPTDTTNSVDLGMNEDYGPVFDFDLG